MIPLIPLAIQLVPSLARWLFGADAAATVEQVTQAVQTVTGSVDPGLAATALRDPALASQLTVQLAQIAAARETEADAARQATLIAILSDVANARGQTTTLVTNHSPIAYGAPVVSIVVMLTFGAMLGCLMTFSIPDSALALANVMLGTLGAMATSVVNYWVGSSAGSAQKSNDLRAAADQMASVKK